MARNHLQMLMLIVSQMEGSWQKCHPQMSFQPWSSFMVRVFCKLYLLPCIVPVYHLFKAKNIETNHFPKCHLLFVYPPPHLFSRIEWQAQQVEGRHHKSGWSHLCKQWLHKQGQMGRWDGLYLGSEYPQWWLARVNCTSRIRIQRGDHSVQCPF